MVRAVVCVLPALALFACKQDYEIAIPKGTLQVEPLAWDAGRIPANEERVAEYTLTRLEGQAVVVSAAVVTDLAGGFFASEVDYGPDTELTEDGLPRIDAVPLVVRLPYRPTAIGWHAARVEIVNDSLQPSIWLDARGRAVDGHAVVRPALIEFGPVPAGGSRIAMLTLENDGHSDVVVEAGVFSNPAFSFTGAPPFFVPEGATLDIPIQFVAPDALAFAGSVDLMLADGLTVPTVLLRANDCEFGTPALYDDDGDGYTSCAGDCDDANVDVHPGVVELADGVDQDCDSEIDEQTELADDDGDGFAEADGDCNDADPSVSPGATQVDLNGIDDDCDGRVDPGALDGDGDGYAALGGDCDDADSAVYPDALEATNGRDDDCDGIVDEGTSVYDDDGDGVTEAGGDCDDASVAIHAGAAETANGVDDDCDGRVDEGTEAFDDDGDGFTEDGGDCDDGAGGVHPGAVEAVGDGVDNDCDGRVE